MPGLLRGVARTAVVAGTATAVSNRVSRRQANRWAAQEPQYQEPQYAEPQPPPPAAANSSSVRTPRSLSSASSVSRSTGSEDGAAAKAKVLEG